MFSLQRICVVTLLVYPVSRFHIVLFPFPHRHILRLPLPLQFRRRCLQCCRFQILFTLQKLVSFRAIQIVLDPHYAFDALTE